ncbi:MAG: single-stranded-DNA-specific exonuclease RecJ [Betaproteobacteria bacterium]
MKWVLDEPDAGAAAMLSDQAGFHPLIARLMVNRGITGAAEARFFLSCELSALSDPRIFSQIEPAVSRIRKAVARGEKIVVYGDYDVDGVTGTSLLYLALKRLGAQVSSYIPDRMTEGYGLNAGALESLKASGAGLVISVDCGITAHREAAAARLLGLDLIITDHHEFKQPESDLHIPRKDESSSEQAGRAAGSGSVLPDAYAVLHPLLLSPDVPDELRRKVSGLTGVGIVFKLVQALLGVNSDDEGLRSYLDLVTLGTVADIGRITGENRILVKHGLEVLSSDVPFQRQGIAALKQVAGLNGKRIGVGTVGFTIAPRINASGRLERADMSFRLLTTDSPEEARQLASALDSVNKERQSVEVSIWEDARRLCFRSDPAAAGALVLSSDQWHPGVIGIVASRLVEEFYRPTALICIQNGVGKGSARSIPGFDLYAGLAACSGMLLGFGGHKYAAGFTIAEEQIPAFRERLSNLALEQLGAQGFIRTLTVEGAVTFDELTIDVMREMDKLAPFGQGNPEPRLGARGLEVMSSRIVGNNHLKFRLRQGNGPALDAIAFNKGSLLGRQVRDGARLAAVFTPRLNAWNGATSVELEIRDLKTEKENPK